MGRMKGQISADYVTSAFIFSLVILFTFVEITRTYYSRTWTMTRAEAGMDTEKLALFLTKSEGNWTANPFNSTSLAFGGDELNTTRLRWFVGMPYPTVERKLGLQKNFKMEVWTLPSIGVTSDLSEYYCNSSSVSIQFTTTENSTLYMAMVGGEYPDRHNYAFNSTGLFHTFTDDLPNGLYTLKALANTGRSYGVYSAAFRVIPC